VVIQQLPNPLRDAICIFYLVLRGLDTVEDDMSIPVEEKLPALLRFHDDIYDRSAAGPTIQQLGCQRTPAHLALLHVL
jgi:phytoene/squalene synthetase